MSYITNHFPINTKGRDFIAGDVHGNFSLLSEKQIEVNFNPEVDRLFLVGDCVDRGEQSVNVLKWLAEPYVHCIRGNHEQMAIDYYNGDKSTYEEWMYLRNGGAWFINLSDAEQKRYVEAFQKLPYAMDVATSTGLVGIVHAECLHHSWQQFLIDLHHNTGNIRESAIWGRTRIRTKYTDVVNGVDRVYAGHTVVDEVVTLGNVTYIDTGAVFNGTLTFLQIN